MSNEINYPTYGISVIPPGRVAAYKDTRYVVNNGYFNLSHHPKEVREMSVDKYELLRKITHCDDHYVVPVTDNIPCVTVPEADDKTGVIQFDLNVDRYINVNLSNIFKTEKQIPRHGLIGSEVFESIYKGTSWFWFMETKDNGLVGMRAFVLHTTIQCEYFHLTKNNILTFIPAGRPENKAVAFVQFAADTIKQRLEHERVISEQQKTPGYDATLFYPKHNINIALDFDGTVTSDYYGFMAMAKMMRDRGHKVYLVTMRYKSECERDKTFMDMAKQLDGFIHTDRQAKRPFCLSKGIKIHVWIDDNPEAVTQHAVQIWGSVSPEGDIVIEEHGTKVTNGE